MRTNPIPSKLFAAPSQEQARRPIACAACRDAGILELEDSGGDPMRQFAACACRAGDEWRPLLAAVHDPPGCIDCGKSAAYCLLSTTPRCLTCERVWNRQRRKRQLAVEIREVMA